MGVSLSIAEKHVWHLPQFFQGCEQNWNFPKAHKARHVGELQRHDGGCTIHLHHLRIAEHNHAAYCPIRVAQRIPVRPRFQRLRACQHERRIQTRNRTNLRQLVCGLPPFPEPLLNLPRFGRRDVPPMQLPPSHLRASPPPHRIMPCGVEPAPNASRPLR